MFSATSSPNGQSPRIPAWKRLGLKLKFASDTLDSTAIVAASTDSPKAEETRQKKRKADTGVATPTKKAKTIAHAEDVVTSTNSDSISILSRKKSVTFTPETKEEDGDSIKQLFSAWVAEQKAQDPTFGTTLKSPALSAPEPVKVDEQVDTTLEESERRIKRVKKPKSERVKEPKKGADTNAVSPAVTNPPSVPTRPFLAYLRRYHESRDTWKFNKNHQDRILKHFFDVEIIPSEYSHLLYEYVRGLQGGVRTRLRDSALAVKVKDQEEGAAGFPSEMAEIQKRQLEYEVAMKEYVATMTAAGAHSKMGYEEGIMLSLSDAAMGKRAIKRLRSEQVLRELGAPEEQKSEVEDDAQKRLRLADGSAQKLGRRRKQRTMATESDSSSSDDSSDSDSDLDTSSDESDAPKANADRKGSPSSSSSSSSSSEAESESDSSNGESDESDQDE